jgi:site-specific DNA-methyltransferase (adenine-specific)
MPEENTNKIREVHVSELNLDPRNPRKRTELSAGVIKKSLEQFGACRSIVIDESGTVRAGNGTLQEASQLGIEKVIIVEATGNELVAVRRAGLTDEQWKQYAVADNTSSDFSTWDAEALAELSAEVDLSDFFPNDKLDELLKEIGEPDLEEDKLSVGSTEENLDDIDEVGKIESRVKLGEIWQLGKHKICCGDSTISKNIEKLIGYNLNNIDMIWADPPYGINLVPKNGKVGSNSKKYVPIIGDETKEVAYKSYSILTSLIPQACHIFWGANHFASIIKDSSCWIVWDKNIPEGVGFADCELGWTNLDKPARIFRHTWSGFLKDSEKGENRVHPTQKPIALCEWFFEKYGQPNDIIFDPFLGSAPSIIAAEKMEGNRQVFGFELSPDYCEIIIQRYEKFTGGTAKLIGKIE